MDIEGFIESVLAILSFFDFVKDVRLFRPDWRVKRMKPLGVINDLLAFSYGALESESKRSYRMLSWKLNLIWLTRTE